MAKSLFGILPKDADMEAARAERMGEIWSLTLSSGNGAKSNQGYRD